MRVERAPHVHPRSHLSPYLWRAGMGRREMRTRLCLGVFAVVLVGIIIGVIVWIVKSRQNQG